MIEVGEYVRTKNGYIAKAKDIICKGYPVKKLEGYVVCDDEDRTIIDPKEVKHSKNIIDLIEVGDFINGMKIDDIGEIKRFGKTAQKCLWVNIGDGIDIIDEEIKDILTKEQHMQNCYKIAEENSSIN